MRFARIEGVLVEPLGEAWVAFSPVNGQTSLLNDESAAMLEVLALGPRLSHEVVALLAEDCGQPVDDVAPAVDAHWQHLVDSGLVRPVTASGAPVA